MNSYGLGLILNFVDNASSGMRGASNTFRAMSQSADAMGKSVDVAYSSISQLATSGTVMTILGDSLANAGSKIVSSYYKVGSTIIDTGVRFEGYNRQFTALYGSAEKGAEVVNIIKDYARTSIFTVEDLISSVSMMKTVGIEALNDVTTTTGKTTQKLMDYASDIAAMIPNIRNTYGTGVAGAMGAFKEYIAEGNALTLKRSAGLDITGILGEDKGKTIEERTQQIADLIEKLNIAGYTAAMFNTPQMVLSNLSDYWINFMDAVSNTGVYDKYTELIQRLGTFVKDLVEDTSKYQAIINVVSDVLNSLLEVAGKALDKILSVADAFSNWAETNPKLAKSILYIGAAIGGLLLLSGLFSKYLGSFFLLEASFLTMRQSLGGIFISLGASFASTILPMIGLIVLLRRAWIDNFLNIQGFTNTILKTISLTFKALFIGVSDGTTRFADLSVEDFELAKQLGILPFIEAMLELKSRVGDFVKGFKDGFGDVLTTLGNLISKFFKFTDSVGGLIGQFGTYLKQFTGIDSASNFEKMGQQVGSFTAKLLIAVVVFKALTKVFSIGKSLFSGVSFGFSLIAKGAGLVKTALSLLFSPLGIVIAVIAVLVAGFMYLYNTCSDFKEYMDGIWQGFLASIENVKGLLIESFNNMLVGLQPVIDWFSEMWEYIKPGLMGLYKGIVWVGITVYGLVVGVVNGIIGIISPLINSIVNVINFCVNLVKGIIAIFQGDFDSAGIYLRQALSDLWNFVCNIFSAIWGFFAGIWNGIAAVFKSFGVDLNAFFVGLWDSIVNVFSRVVSWFKIVFRVAGLAVMQGFNGVCEFFSGIWNGIVSIFFVVIGWFRTKFSSAGQAVMQGFSGVVEFFSGIWNSISGFFSNAYTSITGWFSGIGSGVVTAVGDMVGWATDAWNSISGAFSGAYDSVVGWFSGIGDGVASAVGDVTSWATDAWNNITGAFSNIWETFSGFGSDILEGLKSGISTNIENAKQSIVGWFGGIWDGVKSFFGINSPSTLASDSGGYVVQGFEDGVSNRKSNALEVIGGVFKAIWDGIRSIFGFGGGKSEEAQQAEKTGNDLVDGITTGMSDTKSTDKAVSNIVTGILDNFNTQFGITGDGTGATTTKNIGISLAQGLNEGLNSVDSTYFDDGANAIQSAINTSISTALGVTSVGLFGTGGTGAVKYQDYGKAIIQGIVWGINDSISLVTESLTTVSDTNVLGSLTANDATILSSWNNLTGSISDSVLKMTNSITSNLNKVSNAFSNLNWKLPKIKTPKISISSYSTPMEGVSVPNFSVSWNRKGGIFNTPTIFSTQSGMQGVGEAGAEAVIPISELWSEMGSKLDSAVAKVSLASKPVILNTEKANRNLNGNNTRISNNSEASTVINFEKGSFVVEIANTNDSELEKVADKLIKIIKRKTEIKKMAIRNG